MTREELINKINALEEQMKVCGYGSEELQELIDLKNMLDILDGGIEDEKENN